MRLFFFLNLLLGLSNVVCAQIIPVFSGNTDSTGKTVKTGASKVKRSGSNSNTAIVKFTSDAEANIYIDGVPRARLLKETPTIIKLAKGSYLVQVVSASNIADKIEFNYVVSETGVEMSKEIPLGAVIAQRLNAEAAAAKAQRERNTEFNFSDDFNDNRNGWPVVTDSTREVSVIDGSLLVKGIDVKYTYYTNRNFGLDINKDFSCSVIVKWVTGIDNNGFGIDFCDNSSAQQYYTFLISANGQYQIYSLVNNTFQSIVNWTASDFINKNSIPNKLLIRKQGDYFSFFINDNKVQTIPLTGSFGNSFGCRVCINQTVEFRKFVLTGTQQ